MTHLRLDLGRQILAGKVSSNKGRWSRLGKSLIHIYIYIIYNIYVPITNHEIKICSDFPLYLFY